MSEFSLPGSSFSEIKKIVMSYANAKAEAGLEEIANLAGVHKTVVSRNNKFLSEIGIIQGGQKKSATDLGKRLGRAIEHNQHDDAVKEWASAIQSNEPLSSVMTTVRIKGGMTEEELAKHILYVSGQSNNTGNKTGARCAQDVLVAGGLLVESDGKFSVAAPRNTAAAEATSQAPTDIEASNAVAEPMPPASPPVTSAISGRSQPSINISIQLQLPETKDAEVYEKLFKALKENLYPD